MLSFKRAEIIIGRGMCTIHAYIFYFLLTIDHEQHSIESTKVCQMKPYFSNNFPLLFDVDVERDGEIACLINPDIEILNLKI